MASWLGNHSANNVSRLVPIPACGSSLLRFVSSFISRCLSAWPSFYLFPFFSSSFLSGASFASMYSSCHDRAVDAAPFPILLGGFLFRGSCRPSPGFYVALRFYGAGYRSASFALIWFLLHTQCCFSKNPFERQVRAIGAFWSTSSNSTGHS